MTGVTFLCVAPSIQTDSMRGCVGWCRKIAPRDGAPTIAFRRVGLEPMEYELRVENDATHPFTLTLTTWQ